MLPILFKSVIAKVIAASAVGLGGYEAWKHFYPKVQSLRTVGPSGHPIQVVVPVKHVVLRGTVKSQASAPVPPNNGSQAIHLPPPQAPTGMVAMEPTVITPTGAANLSIDNVSDIQNALNTLGWSPPLAADGILGPLTKQAILSFQASHGLMPDGMASSILRSSIQQALARIAGTQAHIGQSLPVQSAPQTVNGAASPIPEIASVAIASPVGKSLINSGLSAVASLFSSSGSGTDDTSDDSAMNADTPDNAPKKDAITTLQHALNMLGASPPLTENGKYNDETIAAIKAFQITFGLAADGVPGPKTATAVSVALDPTAQQAIVPSVAKAADHVDSIAAAAPPTTAPTLAKAASDLSATAASTPVPTEVQTHASTAAAQAATASSAAPPGVAEPLADASHALAAATTTPVPDPTLLVTAASALSTAAAAAAGSTSAPSIAAAAGHLASAATAPDTATQGDHLNAAAAHLANAATGATSPATATATANGEFGGFMGWLSNWWHSPNHFWRWHSRMHPTYAPAIPAPPPAQPNMFHGEFGYGGMGGMRGGMGGRRHHHNRQQQQQWQQQQAMQQQNMMQGGGGMMPPAPPPPQDDGSGDFGWGGGGYGGGFRGGYGGGFRDDWRRQPSPWADPWSAMAPPDGDFGAARPAPPTGTLRGGVFQPSAYGQSLGMTPTVVARPSPPIAQNNSAYWNARNQTLGYGYGSGGYGGYGGGYPGFGPGPGGYGVPFDRRWAMQNAQQSPDDWRRRRHMEREMQMQQEAALAAQQAQPVDPNVSMYVDPNAGNPAVQDPSIDAQSNGGVQPDDSGGGD